MEEGKKPKIDLQKLKSIIEAANPGVQLTILDPNTMTQAEMSVKLEELRVKNQQYIELLDSIFKQIHNDNIGAPIERYYEDAENICNGDVYFFNKLKKRIKKYFEER